MGFSAKVIVIGKKYPYGNDTNNSIYRAVVQAMDQSLRRFNLAIERGVPFKEYLEQCSSGEVHRYIHVEQRQLVLENRETQKGKDGKVAVQVGSGRYEFFEQFASMKYFQLTITTMGDKTAVWISYNDRIERYLPGFTDFVPGVAELLSRMILCEIAYLRATSVSRRADEFAVFVNGKLRNTLSGKTALTDVRDQYGFEINTVMEAIDECIAIKFAPHEYASACEGIVVENRRFELLKAGAEEVAVTDKITGDNMIVEFERENRNAILVLERRRDAFAELLKRDEVGSITHFRVDRIVGAEPSPEQRFGKNAGAAVPELDT